MIGRWGLLLVNLGTPSAPETGAVRRYLREFLSDPRVLDIHPVGRFFLLNLFILPFRPAASAEAYRKVWTERGSPLLVYSQDLLQKVRARVKPDDVHVELAMRYQEPSLAGALERLRAAGCDRVAVFPLYPQYASSSTGSSVEEVWRVAGQLWNTPSLQVVPPFYDHPAFLDAFTQVARPVLDELSPDLVLMSFHGLPERQVKKSDESGFGRHCLATPGCCDAIVDANRMCYRAQCYATARGLAERLGVAGRYEVSFQSRLGRTPWIQPFTDVRVRELAAAGKKRIAVMSPAFVADCLETLEEIGMRLRDDFRAAGGEELWLVPSLNATDAWVDAVVEIARETTGLPSGA